MAMTQRLELRQSQSLVMTPQLQQAIKLLQMSSLDLKAYVAEQVETNPLLEARDGDDVDGEDRRNRQGDDEPTGADSGEQADLTGALNDAGAAGEKLAALDTDLANVYENASRDDLATAGPQPAAPEAGWTSPRGGGMATDSAFDFESTVSEERTLADHLSEQLNLSGADAGQRLIGQYLIGMLDDAGYLSVDCETAADTLGASVDQIEAVVGLLQSFDPPGVCARNLKECLRIQLTERDRLDPAMAALIDNLEVMARRDFERLQKVCGVDLEDIRDMVEEIRRLNPKPGNAFGALIVQPVVPDVYVRPAQDGTWAIELNPETLPRVLVNNQYMACVSSTAMAEEDRLYLSQCMANATWLVKSLDQRARTILAVAREIVRQQDGFLVHGVSALRPLTLKTIAEAIDMHESTVSRVTSNKYMATPRGIFELKYFFSTAIASSEGGEALSSESVRHEIRSLVAAETADKVLSDDMLVKLLREKGIDIARRTVAKYREAMGIASSVQRRRELRAQL